MSLDRDYDELSLEEQAELTRLLSGYSAGRQLTDDDLESIAGGVSNENIKKVLSYGIAALTGAGITVGGMALLHHNHHPHEGGPHAGTHFAEHKHHRKHNNMPPQGEHKQFDGERYELPKREHKTIPPRGERSEMPDREHHQNSENQN